MKNVIIWVLAGALLGVAIASFIVPPMVSWYMTPGGIANGTAMVQIPDTIRYATTFLLKGQAIGAGLGAIFGLLLAFATRKKPAPTPASSPVT